MDVRRWMCRVLVAVMALPAWPAGVGAATVRSAAADDTRYLRCESGAFGRYKECAADTDGRVELVRELSRNKCRQWNSWGYDRRGVWVDKGCRAEFRVGKEGGGIGAGGAAVIGAVAGAAIIAAIVAGRNKDKGADASRAPSWATGSFRGFNPKEDVNFDIRISDEGTVSGTANDESITGYTASGDKLVLGDAEFDMKREDWGFAAKDRKDDDNVVYFRRR